MSQGLVPGANSKRSNEQLRRYHARANAKYERDAKRVLATRVAPPLSYTPLAAALNLMFPWRNARNSSQNPYPGYTALVLALFEMRAAATTVKLWRGGKINTPQWAIELVAARLEREAKERWAIAKKLRESTNKKATP